MNYEALATIHARAMDVPAPWTALTIEAFATAPGGFLITSENGFALGRVIADEAEVLTLAVDPDHQGQGQGRALMEGFETRARSLGAARGFLDVARTNVAARALYQAFGWQSAGQRKGYYRSPNGARIDALLLQKSFDGE